MRIRDTEEVLKEVEEVGTEIIEIYEKSKNKHCYKFSDEDINRLNELRSHLRNLCLELNRSKYKSGMRCENEDN